MNRFATTLLLLSFHLMACGGSLEDFDSILGMGQADFTIEIEEGPGSQESSLSIHSSRTVMNVPVLDQNNNSITSDCGLTATRMVFEYYGSIMRSFEPDSGAGLEGMTESTMVGIKVVIFRTLAGWRVPPILPHVERIRGTGKGMVPLVVSSLIVGLLTSALYTIWLCYQEGG